MVKNLIHDIVPPDKRSIRQIPLPERKRVEPEQPAATPSAQNHEPKPVANEFVRHQTVIEEFREAAAQADRERERISRAIEPPHHPEFLDSKFGGGRRWSKKLIGAIVAIVLVAAAIGFPFLISGASIKVQPKVETIPLDIIFSAKQQPIQGELGYSVMTLEKDGDGKIAGSESQQVETRASGQIIVYNNQSAAEQRLIKNTRFETSGGLVFRIQDSIVVPGTKIENGKTIPGSIEVTVYADEVGDRYNIDLTDFKIPGFKGDPRYETMYARSKTKMSGGFSGMKKVVPPQALADLRTSVRQEVLGSLSGQAHAQKPAEYVIFKNGHTADYESLADTEDGQNLVIHERVTYHGILFEQAVITQAVARQVLKEDPMSVRILNLGDLEMEVLPESDLRNGRLSFRLKGEARVVWNVDDAKLKNDLAGKSRNDIQSVLSSYPAINKAEAVLRPFWKGQFPSAEEITVEVDMPKS